MRWKDLKIRSKLMGGFVLVLCLAATQTFYAVYQVSELNDNSSQIANQWLPGILYTGAISTKASRLRAVQFQHILTLNEDNKKALEKEMDTLQGAVATDLQSFASLIRETQQKSLYTSFETEWKKYLAQQTEIVQLARQRRDEEALDILKGPARQTFEALMVQLSSLSQFAQDGAAKARDASATLQARVMFGSLGALLVTIILGLFIARTLNRSVSGGLSYAMSLASKVAKGDLSAPINPNTKDELGELLHSLRDMQTSLVQVVSRVRSGSESVSTASAEIAQGNQDLNSRTESQASALEQTAASMEELSSTVKQNADNARRANQLAQSASTVAVKGGEVVAQVVDTMKGINDASKKISDIISVIDGIAFQTNILALNAAVEAARAGEQGRGFAVVASEVRSLAGRSADAAKEIKNLINDSVQRVEQGTALVDQAGITMTEVVSSIRRVTDIMGEISAASNEQSLGVAQVGEAVTQMDQATQQNAALVEEMASAASSLRSQAQDLVGTVAVFKLAQGQSGGMPHSSPTQQRTLPARPAPAPAARQLASAPKAKLGSGSRPPTLSAPAAAAPKAPAVGDDWESF